MTRHPIYSDYAVDENGNIFNIRTNRMLKQSIGKGNPYARVTINKKTYKVHKFVWECFNGLIDSSNKTPLGLTIDHIDGDKTNNKIDNLQILSLMDNASKYHKNKSSLYHGVTIGRGYWRSFCCNRFLGQYINELDAAIRVDDEYELLYSIRPNKTISIH